MKWIIWLEFAFLFAVTVYLVRKRAWFLHLGRMSADMKTQLAAEGNILYSEESICQTVRFNNFRAPGFYRSSGIKGFLPGYFVLTECRVIAKARFFSKIDLNMYNKVDFNLRFDEPAFKEVVFLATPKYLSIKYDPSTQIPEASGKLEVRLRLSDIITPARILLQKGAVLKTKGISL